MARSALPHRLCKVSEAAGCGSAPTCYLLPTTRPRCEPLVSQHRSRHLRCRTWPFSALAPASEAGSWIVLQLRARAGHSARRARATALMRAVRDSQSDRAAALLHRSVRPQLVIARDRTARLRALHSRCAWQLRYRLAVSAEWLAPRDRAVAASDFASRSRRAAVATHLRHVPAETRRRARYTCARCFLFAVRVVAMARPRSALRRKYAGRRRTPRWLHAHRRRRRCQGRRRSSRSGAHIAHATPAQSCLRIARAECCGLFAGSLQQTRGRAGAAPHASRQRYTLADCSVAGTRCKLRNDRPDLSARSCLAVAQPFCSAPAAPDARAPTAQRRRQQAACPAADAVAPSASHNSNGRCAPPVSLLTAAV